METVQLALLFPTALLQRISALSEHIGLTRADFIKSAILAYLVNPEAKQFQRLLPTEKLDSRITVRVTPFINQLCKQAAEQLDTSVNQAILYAVKSNEQRYTQLLTKLDELPEALSGD